MLCAFCVEQDRGSLIGADRGLAVSKNNFVVLRCTRTMDDVSSPGQRLEQYSLRCPDEVLIVEARAAGETDMVMVFKGFSSSLMRATDYDPDVPVLPVEAEIVAVDRLKGPYQPDNPEYIAQGLRWDEFEALLASLGL